METKDVLRTLRAKNGMSQDALAEKVFVTRQAVSRWENGETVPHMVNESTSEEQVRAYMKQLLPRLARWKSYGSPSDDEQY